MNPDLIGWIGNIGFIIGMLLIARKRSEGFYLACIGNVSYLVVGILLKLSSAIILSAVLGILNIYGIIRWRKDERDQNKRRI